MKTGRLLVVSCILFAVSGSLAAFAAQNQRSGSKPHNFTSVNGSCSRLIVGGKDSSGQCENRLLSSSTATAGTQFYFWVRDFGLVTFAGFEAPAKGRERVVQVDEVIVKQAGPGVRPLADHSNEMTAAGTCTYTNLYAGPSHIDCTASTEKGLFSAAFLSDGKPPALAHQ